MVSTAKNKNLAKSLAGFTIVETMIVLAVTGVLFVSMAGIINGKQQKAQFTQSINSIQQQIEQTIGEVQSGYFPGNNDTKCEVVGGALHIEQGSKAQGTNEACAFLGKVLKFHGTDTPNPTTYDVYSIAGIKNAESFADSAPTVAASASDTGNLQYQLMPAWMRAGGTDIGAVGFVSFFSKSSSSGLLFGSQSTQVLPVQHTSLSDTSVSSVNNNLAGSYANINPSDGVQICFNSGTTSQSGLITIGNATSQNSVTLSIKQKQDCVN